MEIYYGIMFMVAAILQDSYEGFIPSIWLSCLMFFNVEIISILGLVGFSFYAAAVLFDILILLPLLMFFSYKLVRWICIIVCISILLNLMFFLAPSSIYALMIPYYGLINILLVEAILLYSLSQSRMKSGIKWLFNRGPET